MKYPDLSRLPTPSVHLKRNPGTYYCVARIVVDEPPEYLSATTDEERAYSHLHRLRKQGQTSIGMVELDRKPPGVKAPPTLRKQQQGSLFGSDAPDDPQGSLFDNPEYADDEVCLEYGVIENTNKRKGGWIPVVWQNGRLLGSDWSTISYDKHTAMEMAPAEAAEVADRYSGDWDITMRPRQNPAAAPGRWRIRYRDENDPGCPIFSLTVRAWDRESAEEAFYDAPDGEGWQIISIKRAPKRNPGRAEDSIYATSRRSREREPLYTTLTLLGGTVYRDSTPIAFWAGRGDGGPNEGYRPHPAADQSERETLVEFNQFRGYSTNPALAAAERHELPSADFAVPEHEGLPIDTPGRTRAAMARFNQYNFDHNQQRKKAYRRILARARRFGIDPAGFQARWVGAGG